MYVCVSAGGHLIVFVSQDQSSRSTLVSSVSVAGYSRLAASELLGALDSTSHLAVGAKR